VEKYEFSGEKTYFRLKPLYFERAAGLKKMSAQNKNILAQHRV